MDQEDQKNVQFHDMGLDDRILKAIAKLGWCEPTLIQQKAIPFILDGKDVLTKGRTGMQLELLLKLCMYLVSNLPTLLKVVGEC